MNGAWLLPVCMLTNGLVLQEPPGILLPAGRSVAAPAVCQALGVFLRVPPGGGLRDLATTPPAAACAEASPPGPEVGERLSAGPTHCHSVTRMFLPVTSILGHLLPGTCVS